MKLLDNRLNVCRSDDVTLTSARLSANWLTAYFSVALDNSVSHVRHTGGRTLF